MIFWKIIGRYKIFKLFKRLENSIFSWFRWLSTCCQARLEVFFILFHIWTKCTNILNKYTWFPQSRLFNYKITTPIKTSLNFQTFTSELTKPAERNFNARNLMRQFYEHSQSSQENFPNHLQAVPVPKLLHHAYGTERSNLNDSPLSLLVRLFFLFPLQLA